MKKLLLILLCVPMMFSCGEEKVETKEKTKEEKRLLIDELYEREVGQQYIYFYQGKPFTGVAIDIYDSGEVKWEGNYKNGILHGEWKEWCYQNSTNVSTLGYFKRMSADEWYHMKDPEMKTEIYYGFAPEKFKHGIWKTWNCYNNILLLEEEYENGEIISRKCWDNEGKKIKCK